MNARDYGRSSRRGRGRVVVVMLVSFAMGTRKRGNLDPPRLLYDYVHAMVRPLIAATAIVFLRRLQESSDPADY